MGHIVIFLLIALMFYILMRRRGTSLQLVDDKRLILRTSQKEIRLDVEVLEEKESMFSSFTVTQTLLRGEDGRSFVFERVLTADDYLFDQQMKVRVIKAAFDAKELHVLGMIDDLVCYQALLPDDEVLDVIACQSDTQAFRLLYGLSDETLGHIIKEIDISDAVAERRPGWRASHFKDIERSVTSRWDRCGELIEPFIIPQDALT